MRYTLLQIDPNGILNSAANVRPGDNSGYTFAIVVLTFVLLICLYALKSIYEKNNNLQNAAVARAETATTALVNAINAMEEQYKEHTRAQNQMNEILKDFKHRP